MYFCKLPLHCTPFRPIQFPIPPRPQSLAFVPELPPSKNNRYYPAAENQQTMYNRQFHTDPITNHGRLYNVHGCFQKTSHLLFFVAYDKIAASHLHRPCLYSSIRKSFFQARCTQPKENRLFLSDFDHSFFSFLLHLFQKANMFKTANK